MFSSLLRPRNRGKRSGNKSPSPVGVRRPLLQQNGRVIEDGDRQENVYADDVVYDDEDESDEDELETPLLPIFSSEHLGKIKEHAGTKSIM